MVDFMQMSKVWCLSMEFYGTWQEVAMHLRTSYIRTKLFFIGKYQNVHTADLGYLGFLWIT